MKRNLQKVQEFMKIVDAVTFDPACADTYSHIRVDLRKRGRPIGVMDLLIASVALTHHATVVTHNRKHFEPIRGLKVEDWLAI